MNVAPFLTQTLYLQRPSGVTSWGEPGWGSLESVPCRTQRVDAVAEAGTAEASVVTVQVRTLVELGPRFRVWLPGYTPSDPPTAEDVKRAVHPLASSAPGRSMETGAVLFWDTRF